MNRKGFTLIEIIMCVVLIAVIGIVVGVNSDKIFGNDQNKDVTQTIISAAEVYASGNAGVVDQIYNGCGGLGCGFVTVTIGELKEDGLLDEDIEDANGNVISDTTPILVTRNEDGYLEYTLYKDDMSQGYVVANTLTIAKGDDFKCDYYVGNPEGLTFNKKDGTNISSQMTYVSNITQDNQYTCEESIDASTAANTSSNPYYTVKYHYQIDGVTKDIERQIVVLDEFNYDINRDNFVAQQHYLEETSANNYTLYTTNDTYDLTIDPDSTYVNKAIKIVYEKDGVKQTSKTFSGLGVGTYTFKINISDKEKVYNDTDLLAKTNFVTTKTFNLTIKKVPELAITNEVFKDEDNKVVLNTDWNTGKKISFTLNNEDIIVSREYKLDTETEAKTFIGNSIPLIDTPANKITITIKDKLGRTLSEEHDIKVDQVPATSPTVTSGTSTTYAISRTFGISLPSNTISGSTYHYYLANSTPSTTTTGTTFNSTSLTLKYNSINSDNIKYLYLKTCNAVGCSSWSQANAYLTKKVSEWTDSNCTVDSSNSSVCYYVGSKSNNYVSYGGKKWRIYKKTAGKLSLILDSSYTSAPYGQVGHCTTYWNGSQGCCNSGRYLYSYLGDYDRTDYSSYGFKGNTMGTTLSNFYKTLTNTSLLEYFTNGYANVNVGLLSRADYMKVAKCTSDTSCSYPTSNYIKSGKSAFWLVDYYTSHNGDFGNYNVDETAKAYNYSVNSSGKIVTSVGSTSVDAVITTSNLSVRPIVQIKSTAKITGGTGTSSNPYTLG